jgi:propionate catabolism operon transcriptional regulator
MKLLNKWVGMLYIYSSDSITNAIQNGLQLANSRRIEIEKAEQFRTILENAQEGILTVNSENTTCIHVNPRALELLNVKKESLIGQPLGMFWPTDNAMQSLRTGEQNLNTLESVSNREIIANYIPVLVDNKAESLVITFQDIDSVQKAEQKIRKKIYSHGNNSYYKFSDIIGSSDVIRDTINIARLFSKSDSTVLITGESGSGKELFAQSIHAESQRQTKPFVAINCGALPEDLLESELFGYEEGAFTGAKRGGQPGLFEIAHKGTLFLDEIGEISNKMQTRLLRVLQEKKIRRVGGRELIPVDVRILAATNRNLKEMVEEGCFRQDLYFRLNVLHLFVPPLRHRKEDISSFVNHFCKRNNALRYIEIINNMLQQMYEYNWPGNVRELENIIERIIVVLRDGNNTYNNEVLCDIVFSDIFPGSTNQIRDKKVDISVPQKSSFNHIKKIAEKEIIQQTLKTYKGNKSKAARYLGISRSTLYKKLNFE